MVKPKLGAKNATNAGVGHDNGTTSDDGKGNADDPAVDEIETPEIVKEKSIGNVSKSKYSGSQKRFTLTAKKYLVPLSRADSIEEKKAIYEEWTNAITPKVRIAPGSVAAILQHIQKELMRKMEKPEVDYLLNFMLKVTEHIFSESILRYSNILQEFPGLLLQQKSILLSSEAIRCLLTFVTDDYRGMVEEAFLDAVPDITSPPLFSAVLPIVLSNELDLAQDTAIAQVQAILSKAEEVCQMSPSESLDLFGGNLDEDIKKAILNTGASPSPPQPSPPLESTSSSRKRRNPADPDSNKKPRNNNSPPPPVAGPSRPVGQPRIDTVASPSNPAVQNRPTISGLPQNMTFDDRNIANISTSNSWALSGATQDSTDHEIFIIDSDDDDNGDGDE